MAYRNYNRTNNPVNDYLDDEKDKIINAIQTSREAAKKQALKDGIKLLKLEPALERIKEATGIDNVLGNFGYNSNSDSELGRYIAKATLSYDEHEQMVMDAFRLTRIKLSLGKDADAKLAIIKQFTEDLLKSMPRYRTKIN